jgi:tetratricopeptide (TPR) repeat protein
LDSRGDVYFKLGQFQRAIQDYDAALTRDERLAPALFARGTAKLKVGDPKGQADIAAAKAINPYIANLPAGGVVAP